MAISELQYQVALTMMPSIGPVTSRDLVKKYGSAGAVFRVNPETFEKKGKIGTLLAAYIRSPEILERAGEELEFMQKHRIESHYFKDPGFPQRLNECKDGPFLLFARGTQGLNPERSLSVVGTRRASSYGRDLCRELIMGLALLIPGVVIVSGLAYGIDVIAHRAALESGLPTVAVLGHGLSTLYPSSHRDTARMIIGQGALVTDFDSGMGPERNNFLRRNRIIAGMSDATLVVESAEKGGALITANMAQSYSRDVLAVPGRTGDHRSVGCNNLIKRGVAALVASPDDIIRHLNWDPSGFPEQRLGAEVDLSQEEKKLLFAIEEIPGITPGELGRIAGLPVSNILARLMEMELKGWISVEPGNSYRSRIHLEG